jgi:hypothetical protein
MGARLGTLLLVAASTAVAATRAGAVNTPSCFGKKVTITGSGTLVGTSGSDVIVGSDTADSIDGMACEFLGVEELAREFDVAPTPEVVAQAYATEDYPDETYGDGPRHAGYDGCLAGVRSR